jgi:hypothetical protein
MIELGFDFENWFHQIFYWWCEITRMGAILPVYVRDALGRRLVAFLNLVMAMGWTWASGIAQRVGNLVICELLRRIDERELLHRSSETPATQAWLARRAALPHDDYGRHDRLWDAAIFTDDPRLVVACSP